VRPGDDGPFRGRGGSPRDARAPGAVAIVMPEDPLLVINPLADGAFTRACHEAMASHPVSPEALEELLSGRYPAVLVRPRSLSSETISVWYVYRDGHWVSSP
jgi:hypothetical protein